MVYFTSDLHIGHKNIHKYRDCFESAEQHHWYMIRKIQELSKRDTLYIIGDFLFDCDEYDTYLQEITKAKCTIKLIMGNHDSMKLYKLPEDSNIEIQLPLFSYKSMWISHCPIHPQEMRNRVGNIHGHLHKEVVMKAHYNIESDCNDLYLPDKKYFNVNIDVNDYKFVTLDQIKDYFGKN